MNSSSNCLKLDCLDLKESCDAILIDSLSILKCLIGFKSYSYEEKDISDFIESFLTSIELSGLTLERIGNNILVSLDLGKQESVVLIGHTDIVKEGDLKSWKVDPYKLTFSKKGCIADSLDGYIQGRGVSDMKGFLAIMLSIIRYSKLNKGKYNLKFLFYDKEEEAKKTGIEDLYENGVLSRFLNDCKIAIVGEPTNNVVHNGVFGYMGIEIDLYGDNFGHSSIVNFSETVYKKLGILISRIEKIQNNSKEKLIINITTISDENGSFNTIPKKLTVGVNVRFSPNLSSEYLKEIILPQLIENLNFPIKTSDDCLPIEFRIRQIVSGSISEKHHVEDLFGIGCNMEIGTYWSDIAILNKLLPAVNFGPGDIREAHSYNERLMLKDLNENITILLRLLYGY